MVSAGIHCFLELYGCPFEQLNDLDFISATLRAAAEQAGATWLKGQGHQFAPSGVTYVGLLAESHISLHSWPEAGYAAVDLFTCGDNAMPEQACAFIVQQLQAERHTITSHLRGPGLTAKEIERFDPALSHMKTTSHPGPTYEDRGSDQ